VNTLCLSWPVDPRVSEFVHAALPIPSSRVVAKTGGTMEGLLIKIPEAAARLGVSRAKVYELIAAVSDTWEEVRDQLAKAFPRIGPLMDDAKAEVLAFTAFPRAHWQKVWSTNPSMASFERRHNPRPPPRTQA
jgi:predicted DNA-binding transcriptional regulator AlpA